MQIYSADYINSLLSNFYNGVRNEMTNIEATMNQKIIDALYGQTGSLDRLLINYLPVDGSGVVANQLQVANENSDLLGSLSVNISSMSLLLENNTGITLYKSDNTRNPGGLSFASASDAQGSATMVISNDKSVSIGYDLLRNTINQKCGLLKIKASDTEPIPEIFLHKNARSNGMIATEPDQNLAFGHFNSVNGSFTSIAEIIRMNTSNVNDGQYFKVNTDLHVERDLYVNNGIHMNHGTTIALSDQVPEARIGLNPDNGEVFVASANNSRLVLGGHGRLTYANSEVYTTNRRPTVSEIGAASVQHTHNYAASNSEGHALNSERIMNYSLSVLTQAQYDNLARKDPNTIYMITD
jgi:hypothetical protein